MKSYFHQPGTISYVYETIPERVKKLADEDPDKTAFVVYLSKEERYEITRKEILDKSLKFAQVLLELGIKPGDRVAYCMSNSIDWMIYDVGIMMTGAVAVHLLMGSVDIKVIISGCTMIILDSKERWSNFLGVAEIQPGGKVTCDACPSLKLAMAVVPESRPANALLASELMSGIKDEDVINFTQLPVVNPDALSLMYLTSGTTGIPKKVCHSHFNIVNNHSLYATVAGITVDDICYMNRPMAYVAGYPLPFVAVGATVVTGDVRFLNDPVNTNILEEIWKTERCTVLFLQPQCLKLLRDLGFRVKIIYSGGDMITEDMIRNSFVLTNKFIVLYGSTETIMTSLISYTYNNVTEHHQGIIGFPISGSEAKIIDEKEEIVEMGKLGKLCIRSPWNTKGYDGNQIVPIKNGWFHTSDVCYMQPNGSLFMKGRSSHFIKKGTVNVSIPLIEDYVGSHPDVEQVVVVGVPDSRFGEEICACVKIASGRTFDENALKEYCDKKMSTKASVDWISMAPSYFLAFDVLPTLSTVKPNRKKIQEMAIERLNLN